MKQIPEVGKTYNCFDDGKISKSRIYTVDVIEIIPFDKIGDDIYDNWKYAVEQHDWLFAIETDYFIITDNGEDGRAVFVRSVDGGWFSIGDFMNSGRLDVDNQLTSMLYNE